MLDLEKEAQDLKEAGDYFGALRLRLKLEQKHQQINECQTQQSRNLNYIAFLAIHTGNVNEAERAARRCLELYRPIAKTHDEKLATYVMMLACVLAESRKFEEAVTIGEEGVAMYAKILGKSNSYVQDCEKRIERMRHNDTRPYLDR